MRLVRCESGFRWVAGAAVCSLLFGGTAQSQALRANEAPPDSSHVSMARLSIFGGCVVASGVAVHFLRYKPLWENHYRGFRFHDDPSYAHNQDKFLHFFGGAVGSAISAKAFSWSGFDQPDAALLGAATSLAFLTFMKIEDGYIDYLGFDRVDQLANIVGAAYPIAQYYAPVLKNFTPKFSYVASKNDVTAKDQVLPRFLADHEGQKFWLGITVYDLLPEELKRYWFPVLGLAVGYTVRDVNTPQPYHETFLALDLDLRKLPGDSQFLKTVWEMLNYVHLPMPAIRISPSIVWYGLYF